MLWSIGSLFLWLVWKLELDSYFSVRNYKHSRGLVRYSDVTIEPKLFTLYSVGGWSQPLPCAIHWIAFNDIKPIRSLGGRCDIASAARKKWFNLLPPSFIYFGDNNVYLWWSASNNYSLCKTVDKRATQPSSKGLHKKGPLRLSRMASFIRREGD